MNLVTTITGLPYVGKTTLFNLLTGAHAATGGFAGADAETNVGVAKVPDEQVMADLDAAADWAAKHDGDPKRLGITGFCWGGRIVWLYAAHNPRLKAGVAWYGRVEGPATALQPRHPIDRVRELGAPVLGLYGGADPGIPRDTIAKMEQALTNGSAAAKASKIVVYPDAPHAFHADYRPSYRQAAAEDGWTRCVAWFKAHGVA